MTRTSTALQDAALGVLAWFFDQIYDGAPDGGGIPMDVQELMEAYAGEHGVTGSREVHEFIESEIAEVT